jgi:hypothetical protein
MNLNGKPCPISSLDLGSIVVLPAAAICRKPKRGTKARTKSKERETDKREMTRTQNYESDCPKSEVRKPKAEIQDAKI